MGLSFRKRNHKNRSPAPVVGDGVDSVSLAAVPASSVDPTSPTATTHDEWGTPVKGGHDDFGSGRIDSDDDDRPDAEEEDETPLRSNHAPTALEKDVGVYPPRMETSAQSDDAFDNPGWLSPEGVAAGMKRGKAGSKRGGGKARDRGAGGALRKMKGIGFLTPPKKDTERVFVDGRRGAESSPPSVMDGEGLFGGERQQEELGVEPPSPPPPVMGPFDPNISNIFGNENGWGGGGGFDSGFEIMLETNIVGEGVDGGGGGGDASGGGGDGRGSSGGPPDEGHRRAGGGGRSKNSSCEHSLAVGTTAQTTVKATNARGSSSPPRRRNLTSLFESVTEDDNDENSVDGTDDGDSDGDGDDGAIAPGDVVNDAGAGGGDDGGLRGGGGDGAAAAAASGDRRVAPAAEGAAADKKSRSALYRLSLTRRGGGAPSARGGPSKRRPAGAAAPPPAAATTSPPGLPAPRKPREPTPPPAPGAPREHEDGVSPPKVPQFITRCDDDVSKTSTLTEPDVARRALAVRARSSQPSLIVGTIAEGFPASGASRSMASGASVAETVDKLWSACPYNLDTAYALLDNVLQFLPCSGEIKDAVDLELEVDEKFALDFQTVGFRDQYFVFPSETQSCATWPNSHLASFSSFHSSRISRSYSRHGTHAWDWIR